MFFAKHAGISFPPELQSTFSRSATLALSTYYSSSCWLKPWALKWLKVCYWLSNRNIKVLWFNVHFNAGNLYLLEQYTCIMLNRRWLKHTVHHISPHEASDEKLQPKLVPFKQRVNSRLQLVQIWFWNCLFCWWFRCYTNKCFLCSSLTNYVLGFTLSLFVCVSVCTRNPH